MGQVRGVRSLPAVPGLAGNDPAQHPAAARRPGPGRAAAPARGAAPLARRKAGQRVGLFYRSANFDQEVFDHPERFDVRRSPNPICAAD